MELKTGSYGKKIPKGGKKVCAFLFTRMIIACTGQIVMCCGYRKADNTIGNISVGTLSKIWNGEQYRRVQLMHLAGEKEKIAFCKDCQMLNAFTVDNIDTAADMICNKIIYLEKREVKNDAVYASLPIMRGQKRSV